MEFYADKVACDQIGLNKNESPKRMSVICEPRHRFIYFVCYRQDKDS